jgi:hypothetical protein
MPNWYDYVPGVGSVVELAKGNYKQAGIDAIGVAGPLGQTIYDKYAGAINEQKQGDLAAAKEAAGMGNNLYTEALGGLNKAEGYFGPAQAMLKNAYGAPGSMTGGPSQYPVAPPQAK